MTGITENILEQTCLEWLAELGWKVLHGLNERQGKALGFLLQHDKLTIQDFEALCPTVNRRGLQRDLKGMLDKNLIVEVGAGTTDPTRHYVLDEL